MTDEKALELADMMKELVSIIESHEAAILALRNDFERHIRGIQTTGPYGPGAGGGGGQ